MFDNFALTAD
jgi:hypothetical protein